MPKFPFAIIAFIFTIIGNTESKVVSLSQATARAHAPGMTLADKIHREMKQSFCTTSSANFLSPLRQENCLVILRDYTYFDFHLSKEVPIILQFFALNIKESKQEKQHSLIWSADRQPTSDLENIPRIYTDSQWNCSSPYLISLKIDGFNYDELRGKCVSINETKWSLAIRPWRCHIRVEHYIPLSSFDVQYLHAIPLLLFTYRSRKSKNWLDNLPKIQILIQETAGKEHIQLNYTWNWVQSISGPLYVYTIKHDASKQNMYFMFDMSSMKESTTIQGPLYTLDKETRKSALTLSDWIAFHSSNQKMGELAEAQTY